MTVINSTPVKDGFYMPAEFAHHRGCFLIWPVRPGSWTNGGAEAQPVFAEIARGIARSEEVWLLCDENYYDNLCEEFTLRCQTINRILPSSFTNISG